MDKVTNDNPPNETPLQAVWGKDNCLEHYTWGDDCFGWTFVDRDDLSIKQELMPGRTSEEMHYHETAEQFFFILSGEATFEIDGQERILNQHQGIVIKPGQKHKISNHAFEDLEFILYSKPSTRNDRINC